MITYGTGDKDRLAMPGFETVVAGWVSVEVQPDTGT